MRVIIFREVATDDHGTVPVRVGAVDIADTTSVATVPDVAMRTYVGLQGGDIPEGVYTVARQDALARRRNTRSVSSRITPEANTY